MPSLYEAAARACKYWKSNSREACLWQKILQDAGRSAKNFTVCSVVSIARRFLDICLHRKLRDGVKIWRRPWCNYGLWLSHCHKAMVLFMIFMVPIGCCCSHAYKNRWRKSNLCRNEFSERERQSHTLMCFSSLHRCSYLWHLCCPANTWLVMSAIDFFFS